MSQDRYNRHDFVKKTLVAQRKFLLTALCVGLFFIFGNRTAQSTYYGEPGTGIHLIEEGPHTSYYVYLPEQYDSRKSWPLVYGLAQFGSDTEDYLRLWVPEARKRGYVVVCPKWHKPLDHPENAAKWLAELCKKVIRRYTIDEKRIILTGFSDGGDLAYFLGLYYPRIFHRVAAVGGHITSVTDKMVYYPAARWKRAAFFVIHGSADEEVPVERAREIVQLFKEVGISVDYFEVEGMKHETKMELTGKVFDWFEKHS